MKESIKNNPRKKALLAAAAVIIVLLLCFILAQVGNAMKEKGGTESFHQPIPPAEETAGPETKTDGYRASSQIEDYWESLGVTEETLSTSGCAPRISRACWKNCRRTPRRARRPAYA